jgi:protein translocase SecG subunit
LQPFLLAVATAAQATLKHAPITAAAKTLPVTVAPTAATPPALMTMTWMQLHASWLTHTVATIGILAAIGLVILLAIQTTKQEGLSGTIGGRVESAYRGRPGMEEQLKKVTGFTAGTFVVAFLILSLTGI